MEISAKRQIGIGWAIIVVMACLLSWQMIDGLKVRNIGGFSPMHFIESQTNPEFAEVDFENGISELRASSIMRLYLLIPREFAGALQCCVIILGNLIVGSAFFVLARIIGQERLGVITCAAVACYMMCCAVFDYNLARFGFPAVHNGQMYGISSGLVILAIAASLVSRWPSAFILIGVAFTGHSTLGAMGGLVVLVLYSKALLSNHRLPGRREYAGGIASLAIISTWVIAFVIPLQHEGLSMNDSDWTNWARIGNFHWYSLDLGILTYKAFDYIVPFCFLVGSSFGLVKFVIKDEAVVRSWRLAVLTSLALGLIGFGIMIVWKWPLGIMLALPRATVFVLLLVLPVVVMGLLVVALEEKNKVVSTLAALMLMALIVGGGGRTVEPLLAVAFLLGMLWSKRWGYLSWAGTLVSILGFAISGKSTPDLAHKIIGSDWLYVIPATLLLLLVVRFFSGYREKCFAFIVIVACTMYQTDRYWHVGDTQRKAMAEVLTVQEWLRDHSARGALVHWPPFLSYAGRDYSGRASFGSPREWLHTSWLYSKNLASFEEGQARYTALTGKDATELVDGDWKAIGAGYERLIAAAREAYPSVITDEYLPYVRDNGINYIVTKQELEEVSPKHKVVFEAEGWTVIETFAR